MPGDETSSQHCGAWKHIPNWQRKEFHRENERRARSGLQLLDKKTKCTCCSSGY